MVYASTCHRHLCVAGYDKLTTAVQQHEPGSMGIELADTDVLVLTLPVLLQFGHNSGPTHNRRCAMYVMKVESKLLIK
jgi:hypothetical protein